MGIYLSKLVSALLLTSASDGKLTFVTYLSHRRSELCMRSIFVLLAAALVASCAVVARTPYTSKNVLGGYSEVQLYLPRDV